MDGGGGDGGRGGSQWGAGGPSGDAARRALSLARARAPLPPSVPPSLRARGLSPSRFPGDEGRGGAEAGTRLGRRPEVSAAGQGREDSGAGAGTQARPRAARAAPGRVCVAPRPRACACVRAFRRCAPGRDAEVKFGERGRDPSARGARVAAITEPSATAGAGEGGEGRGCRRHRCCRRRRRWREGGRVTRQREPRGSGFRGVCVGEGGGSARAARGEPRVEEAAAAGALPRNVAAATTAGAAAVEEATEETGVVR